MVTKKEIFAYQTDASRLVGEAAKVVFPTNLDELQNAVRNAETNIVPRGAGTNLVGGCIPNNSVIIDLSKLNRLKDFTPGSIYAEAGVTLKELNEKLEPLGFEFPINPMNNGISTIGGMIATNASGSRAMKYGQMKDWIDSIDFVTGRGEILKTSKADIMDLCGMEGITGIILGAKLRLIPKVKRTASLFQSENLDDILSLARRLKQEKEVCAADLLGKEISKILGFPEKYNLIIEFDSERGKIQGEDYQKIIEKRDKIFFTMMKNEYVTNEDPKLFFDKLKEFITFLEVNQIPYFSHIGFGIVHPFFKDSEQGKRNAVREFMKKSDAKLGKYGIGILRKEFVDGFTEKIIQRVKGRNDSPRKLNPGKIIDNTHSTYRTQAPKQITGEDLSAKHLIEEFNEATKPTPRPEQPKRIESPRQETPKLSEPPKPLPKGIKKEETRQPSSGPIQKQLSKEEQEKINDVLGRGFGLKLKDNKDGN